MPLHKTSTPKGKSGPCYKWGNTGKTYCGRGAKARAERQGRAIRAGGYGK